MLPLILMLMVSDNYNGGKRWSNRRTGISMNLVILLLAQFRNFSDIDPNSTDLITINYINRPRKYQIEGTNLWVYDGNSDFGTQMRFGTVVFQLQHQAQLFSKQQEKQLFGQAYQNIYVVMLYMIVQLVL